MPAVRLTLFLLTISVFGQTLSAQRSRKAPSREFKPGDEIQYLKGNTWYSGTVLEVGGRAVAIEYFWVNTTLREQVESFKLRFAWEAKAITPMRFWSDESKKFRLRAAAVGLKNGFVRLHKEDDTELSVPISKLSSADQAILKKARANLGPEVPELPALTEFSSSSAGWSASWNDARDLSALEPDAPPSFASVPMNGVGFPKGHFFESLVRLEPIGGADGWMVAGTVDGHGSLPSRVLWASLKAGKLKRIQFLPTGERLAAINPSNRQLLTLNKKDSGGPRLTLWTADPTMENAEPIKSWISTVPDHFGPRGNLVAIVARNRVLHEWGDQQFVVWDTDTNTEVYRIDQESFFDAAPTLSPGKKYLALPEDERVRLIEAATGNTVASLKVEGGSTSGVGFSPDGKKLAVLTRSQLAVWEFGASNEPERFRADNVGTPFAATVEWVDDHSLLIDRKVLYDTQHQLPVWSYETETFEVQEDDDDERTQTVMGGKLCYAVEVDGGSNSSFIIGAVALPGPGVREAVQQLDGDSLYVIRRGHRVSIDVNCGQYTAEVQQALVKQISDNGWVLDSSSQTVLSAEMGRRKTQTIEYKPMHGGGNGQSATVTPFFSSLKLMHNNQLAWSSGTGTGAPSVMFLEKGETAQSRANEMQKPNPKFFQTVDVPEKIFDPTKKNGLGSSLISSRGLTPR